MTLDPSTTALVLIEFQNDFTSEGGVFHDAVAGVMSSTNMLDKAQQAPAATGGAQAEPSGQGINSDAFKAPEKPKGGSSALSRMADDFTKNDLSYTQLAEKYGLPSKGAAEQRLRRFFGESPLAVRERLRQSNP